jgi:hypothetical protein
MGSSAFAVSVFLKSEPLVRFKECQKRPIAQKRPITVPGDIDIEYIPRGGEKGGH